MLVEKTPPRKTITIRLAPSEIEILKNAAANHGLPFRSFIRRAALARLEEQAAKKPA